MAPRISLVAVLLFKGLREFAIPVLDLLEQPCVLNSDHRLVGKGLKQSDLVVAKGPQFFSTNQNSADWNSLSQQQGHKNRPT